MTHPDHVVKPGTVKEAGYKRPGERFIVLAVVSADPEPLIFIEETFSCKREWMLLSEWDYLDAEF